MGLIRRFLAEPLLHFLWLGCCLFWLYGAISESNTDYSDDQIVVDKVRVQQLSAQFEYAWKRPPTREELQGLVENHIKEEVFYREALALGLADGDPVVRVRLVKKLGHMLNDLAGEEPTEQDLEKFLAENSERFATPVTLSFRQALFTDAEGAGAALRAEKALELAQREGWQRIKGDFTRLPGEIRQATVANVSRFFGGRFATQLAGSKLGVWSGPYHSPFGYHLVYLYGREESSTPDLDEVRGQVVAEFKNDHLEKEQARIYKQLRSRYKIDVSDPQLGPIDVSVIGG